MVEERNLLRSSGLVMLGIVASALTGFLREMVIANSFGASRLTDIYLIAFTIPEFLFIMLPVVISSAFIPLFAERRLQEGEERAWGFLSAVGLLLLGLLTAGTLAGILGAPLYLPYLAPGFSGEEVKVTANLVRIMLPSVIFMGLAALASAALNVYRHFSLPALSVAAYNTIFIITAIVSVKALGLIGLAWGAFLGAVGAFGLQAPQLWGRRPERILCDFHHPGIGRFGSLAAPLALGYALHHLAIVVDRAMASGLPAGSISALNYAYRTALVMGQLLGVAIPTVIFPVLAEHVAKGEREELRQALAQGLRWILLLGLPASLGLVALRQPVIMVLFQRGEFNEAATRITSGILLYYVWGVLADALCQPLWRVIYACQDVGTVVKVNGLKTILRIIFNLVFIPYLLYNGIALSASLGLGIQLIILGAIVARHTGNFVDKAMLKFTLKVSLASIAMWAVCQPLVWCLSSGLLPSGLAGGVMMVGLTGLAGAFLFFTTAYILGVQEVRFLTAKKVAP